MRKFSKLSILIFIFLFFSILYPLILMLSKVEWSNFGLLVSSSAFKESLFNSIVVAVISTIISVSGLNS